MVRRGQKRLAKIPRGKILGHFITRPAVVRLSSNRLVVIPDNRSEDRK